MDKQLKEMIGTFPGEVHEAARSGRLFAGPFVNYAEYAAKIFVGFEVIAEMLLIDLAREDREGEEDRLMDRRQKDALLGLIQTSSWLMVNEASRIDDWARKQLKKGEK